MSHTDTIQPMVVTICGSMRFYPHMLIVASELTRSGVIVLMPFAVIPPEQQGNDLKIMLDELHRRKIDMADEVAVVSDYRGYIGESTAGEIAYASQTGKNVVWYRTAPAILKETSQTVNSAGENARPLQLSTVPGDDRDPAEVLRERLLRRFPGGRFMAHPDAIVAAVLAELLNGAVMW